MRRVEIENAHANGGRLGPGFRPGADSRTWCEVLRGGFDQADAQPRSLGVDRFRLEC